MKDINNLRCALINIQVKLVTSINKQQVLNLLPHQTKGNSIRSIGNLDRQGWILTYA